MNPKKPYLQAKSIEKSQSRIPTWVRQSLMALGIQAAAFTGANIAIEGARDITENNVAHAQEANPREAEARDLLRRGTEAFRREDYHTARGLFLRSEAITQELSLPSSAELGWNIAVSDIYVAGFQMALPSDPVEDARRENAHNDERIREILGYTTLAQVEEARAPLIDARDRMRALEPIYAARVAEIDARPAPANATERRARATERAEAYAGVTGSREIVALIESLLGRFENHYQEVLIASRGTGGPDDHHDDGHGEGRERVVIVEGREYIERREDVWFTTPRAITLTTGLAGLVAAGTGLAGWAINNADGSRNLSECRDLQMSMLPCPLTLEREFQANSDRANAFGITAWIGAATFVGSAVLFLALPGESRVTRVPREGTGESTDRPTSTSSLDLRITPVISADTYGVSVSGRF